MCRSYHSWRKLPISSGTSRVSNVHLAGKGHYMSRRSWSRASSGRRTPLPCDASAGCSIRCAIRRSVGWDRPHRSRSSLHYSTFPKYSTRHLRNHMYQRPVRKKYRRVTSWRGVVDLKLTEVLEITGATCVVGEQLANIEVNHAFASDLMSDVLMRSDANAWFTSIFASCSPTTHVAPVISRTSVSFKSPTPLQTLPFYTSS